MKAVRKHQMRLEAPAGTSLDAASVTDRSVEVHGKPYALSLQRVLAFTNDVEGLTKALCSHPQDYAFWAMLEVMAKSDLERADNATKRLYSELYLQHQAELSVGVGKAPTVDTVKSAVLRDPRYIAAQEAETQARETAEYLMVGRQSLTQRLTALVEIARILRAEMDAGMRDRVGNAERKIDTLFGSET